MIIRSLFAKIVGVVFCTPLFLPYAQAGLITDDEVVAIPAGVVGSGNGTLDLVMFIEAGGGGVTNNQAGSFNGDDANSDLPTGGGAGSDQYSESYVTTASDLTAFYDLTFGDGTAGSGAADIDEIVIFLDLNETTPGGGDNLLDVMDVILNPASIPGNPNPAGDVSSAEQNAINQGQTGGTTEANLDAPKLIPLNNQGAGFADYAIFTGINPYSLNPNDVVLFNQTITFLDNGGETKFLSGTFSGGDIPRPPAQIPEPGLLALFGAGLLGMGLAWRRRQR